MPDATETAPPQRDPRPALATYYAVYFAHMGIVLPFLPPWLASRGLGNGAIALLLAANPLAKLAAPWTWGRWADRSGARRGLVVAGLVAAASALAGVSLSSTAAVLFALFVAYAFATAPALPFAEATALEQSERLGIAYGRVRLAGSVSFMAMAAGFGLVVDRLGGAFGLRVAALALALAAAAAVRWPPPGGRATSGAPHPAAPESGRRAAATRLFAAGALMAASHGGYYAFYSIRLRDLGFGGSAIGSLWALAVLCEVLLLTRVDAVVARLGTHPVLRASLVAAALRWTVIAWTGSLPLLAAAQALHALTYAAFHVASLREVFRLFGPGSRATGQTLYSGLTYGLGTFAGTAIAGPLVDAFGYRGLFLTSAAMAAAALVALGGELNAPRPAPPAGTIPEPGPGRRESRAP